MIYPKYVIPAIEDALSRETLKGQRVATAAQRQEAASARFSTEEYLHYADLAAMQIVARVKAVHCAALQTSLAPNGSGNWPSGLDGVHRLIGRGQSYKGNLAARVTHTQNDTLEDRGAAATDQSPRYIWEGGALEIHSGGGTVNGTDAESTVVQSPRRARHHDGNGEVAGGTTLTINSGSSSGLGSGEGFLEEHEQTVAYLKDTAPSPPEYYAARITDVPSANKHEATVDTEAPNGASYEVVWYTHAFVPMERQLESAVVEYATLLCMASQGDDRFEAAMENFQEAIGPYRLQMFNYRTQQN